MYNMNLINCIKRILDFLQGKKNSLDTLQLNLFKMHLEALTKGTSISFETFLVTPQSQIQNKHRLHCGFKQF